MPFRTRIAARKQKLRLALDIRLEDGERQALQLHIDFGRRRPEGDRSLQGETATVGEGRLALEPDLRARVRGQVAQREIDRRRTHRERWAHSAVHERDAATLQSDLLDVQLP